MQLHAIIGVKKILSLASVFHTSLLKLLTDELTKHNYLTVNEVNDLSLQLQYTHNPPPHTHTHIHTCTS